MNSLNHIIIKVELYRAETDLTQCYTCHVWANCKQALNVCSAICLRNALEGHIQNLRRAATTAPKEREINLIQCHAEAAATNEFPTDPLKGRSSLSLPHQSCPSQLHFVETSNTSNHRHRRHMGKLSALHAAASTITENSEDMSISTGSQFV
jgi:hypothetical protein